MEPVAIGVGHHETAQDEEEVHEQIGIATSRASMSGDAKMKQK